MLMAEHAKISASCGMCNASIARPDHDLNVMHAKANAARLVLISINTMTSAGKLQVGVATLVP